MIGGEAEPLFSVVMPAYNAEATIDNAVRSVLSQTLGSLELLVVDDGSTDGTLDRLALHEADGRLRILRQSRGGPSAARNLAIAEARGSIVSFLDSDDIYAPMYLERLQDALAADERAGVAFSFCWAFDEERGKILRNGSIEPPAIPSERDELLALLLRKNFVPIWSAVRRSVLDEVGPFDERLWVVEDYELWLRIVARGFGLRRIEQRLVLYRRRPGTLSTRRLAMNEGLREIYERFASDSALPLAVRSVARTRTAEMGRIVRSLQDGEEGADVHRTMRQLREAAGAARQVLFPSLTWYRVPPREVIDLFPGLLSESDPPASWHRG